MWHILGLLFIYAVLSASAESWNYDEPLNIQSGRIDTIENKTYMVSINSNFVLQRCGGSIISAQYVVTAKHCLRTRTISKLRVRAGSSDWRRGGTVHQIIGMWTRRNSSQDIALLKVEPPFTFNKYCGPIALPDPGYDIVPGVVGEISGWGDTIWQVSNPSDQLRSVELPIFDRNTCSASMLNSRPLLEDEFCASYMSFNREEGFGHGDSGGPFVVDKKLIGVIRRRSGEGIASRTSGQIFMSIPYHRPWITRITGI